MLINIFAVLQKNLVSAYSVAIYNKEQLKNQEGVLQSVEVKLFHNCKWLKIY
jgi:hypothetical protein